MSAQRHVGSNELIPQRHTPLYRVASGQSAYHCCYKAVRWLPANLLIIVVTRL